jgi:hypothetical protein
MSYEVRYGYCNIERSRFASFAESLAFLRGLYIGQSQGRDVWRNHPELVNTDNIDGADDASPAAQHGLTADEWERVQEVS